MRLLFQSTTVALVCATIPQALPAQARAPLAQTLDAAVLRSPETVTIGGRTHLVYELHLTSFLRSDVVITRIQVLDADRHDASLADFRGEELAQILGRPGVRGATDLRRIAPAARVVAYFWIDLAPGARPPRSVRHRIEMQVLGTTDTTQVTFDTPPAAIASGDPVVLGPPLRGGTWVAIYLPRLVGGHRTVYYTMGGKARIPGRFAIDWIRLDENGTMAPDSTALRERNGFGADVLAVADGIVSLAMDDIPDNDGTPTAAAHALENASGNFVAIDIGNGRYAFYEHLQHGSMTVKPGDRVRRGQVIGRLGNSGSSSIGPHLHFHVSDSASALGAEGLPFVFSEFEVLGEFPSFDALRDGERWRSASPDRSGDRRNERPPPQAVVRFR